MGNVSRPLIALLIGTVAFFALWITALKPSGGSGAPKGGLAEYQSAIAAAHHASAQLSSTAPASLSSPASNPGAAPATLAGSGTATGTQTTPSTGSNPAANAQQQLDAVSRALVARRVVALLFWNPASTDDRAVRQELAAVPTHGGSVLRLAVPVDQLGQYPIANDISINQSPTLVVIDRNRQASTIAGFADRVEISQRVVDALGA